MVHPSPGFPFVEMARDVLCPRTWEEHTAVIFLILSPAQRLPLEYYEQIICRSYRGSDDHHGIQHLSYKKRFIYFFLATLSWFRRLSEINLNALKPSPGLGLSPEF